MILAVDPGVAHCGWAVVRPGTGAIVDLGVALTEVIDGAPVPTDRTRRMSRIADVFNALVDAYPITTIVGESVTLGGPPHVKLAMSWGLHLAWGCLVGLAVARELELRDVDPKTWQHAIQPGRKKIDYPRLERDMAKHVAAGSMDVGGKLAAIGKANRNHTLDACGIGMFAALCPSDTNLVINGRRIVVAEYRKIETHPFAPQADRIEVEVVEFTERTVERRTT